VIARQDQRTLTNIQDAWSCFIPKPRAHVGLEIRDEFSNLALGVERGLGNIGAGSVADLGSDSSRIERGTKSETL